MDSNTLKAERVLAELKLTQKEISPQRQKVSLAKYSSKHSEDSLQSSIIKESAFSREALSNKISMLQLNLQRVTHQNQALNHLSTHIFQYLQQFVNFIQITENHKLKINRQKQKLQEIQTKINLKKKYLDSRMQQISQKIHSNIREEIIRLNFKMNKEGNQHLAEGKIKFQKMLSEESIRNKKSIVNNLQKRKEQYESLLKKYHEQAESFIKRKIIPEMVQACKISQQEKINNYKKSIGMLQNQVYYYMFCKGQQENQNTKSQSESNRTQQQLEAESRTIISNQKSQFLRQNLERLQFELSIMNEKVKQLQENAQCIENQSKAFRSEVKKAKLIIGENKKIKKTSIQKQPSTINQSKEIQIHQTIKSIDRYSAQLQLLAYDCKGIIQYLQHSNLRQYLMSSNPISSPNFYRLEELQLQVNQQIKTVMENQVQIQFLLATLKQIKNQIEKLK